MNLLIVVLTLAVIYLTLQTMRLLLAAVTIRRANYSIGRSASRKPDGDSSSSQAIGLTIMQPILSGDPQLHAMLRTNVQQLSEQIRFLWLVDAQDQCGMETALSIAPQAVVRCAVTERPPVRESSDARVTILIFPAPPPTSNPKMFKLKLAIRHVRTELAAVLDDDTPIDAQAVAAAVNALETADLYTGLPSYLRGATFWSDMVAHFVNNNAVLTYLAPLALFPPLSLNGMFYLFRTELIAEVGGFEAIEEQLCDAYPLHDLLRRHGKVVYQGSRCQAISTTVADRLAYFRLLHRWHVFARLLIRDQAWLVRGFLFLTLVLPAATLWLLIATATYAAVASPAVWLLLLVALVARQAIISTSQRLAFGKYLPMNPWLSLLAEVLQPVHALGALASTSIQWRGRSIHLTGNQAFVCSPESSQ